MKNRDQQLYFEFKGLKKKKRRTKHGGEEHSKSRKRKEERPFEPTKLLHVTMRSVLAVGEMSMLHPSRSRLVRHIVFRAAKRHGIILSQFVCVGNHLHFLIRTKSRHAERSRLALHSFLRETAGLIARLLTGARKGRPAVRPEKARPSGRAFWDYLTWSRIVEWGRDLAGIKKYLQKNFQEFICVLAEYHWPSPEIADYG